jgi:CheY-like chemotaxis protein
MNALWIEDIRAEIVPILRKFTELGIAVTLHPAVETALGFLNAEAKWDLIVLDSYFPRQDGASHSGVLLFQALRAGKYGDWGRMVPVLFVTGYADVVSGMIERSCGPRPIAIIPKPADSDQVSQMIREFLNGL